MSLYTLITATVLSTTGQVNTASVLEHLTWQQCEQQMTERRETLRQTPGQRWYLTCVAMPAGQAQPATTANTTAAAAAHHRSVQ